MVDYNGSELCFANYKFVAINNMGSIVLFC